VRPREGLTVLGARSLIGVGLPAVFAVGSAFFGDAGRSGAFFATFFRIVLAFLAVFFAALRAGAFFRFPLALPLAFLLVAITTSRTQFGSPIVAE
jgi:hypothetical protein